MTATIQVSFIHKRIIHLEVANQAAVNFMQE
jgi:hypothetical protein